MEAEVRLGSCVRKEREEDVCGEIMKGVSFSYIDRYRHTSKLSLPSWYRRSSRDEALTPLTPPKDLVRAYTRGRYAARRSLARSGLHWPD